MSLWSAAAWCGPFGSDTFRGVELNGGGALSTERVAREQGWDQGEARQVDQGQGREQVSGREKGCRQL